MNNSFLHIENNVSITFLFNLLLKYLFMHMYTYSIFLYCLILHFNNHNLYNRQTHSRIFACLLFIIPQIIF